MSTPEPTFDPPVDDTDTPRSRRTRRRVRRSVRVASDPRGPISVLVGAGVIAGVVLLGSVLPAQTIAVVPPPVLEPVATTTLVCPEPGGVDDAVVTSAMTSLSGFAGQDGAGAATIEFLDRPGEAVELDPTTGLRAPGDSAQLEQSAGRDQPLTIRTEGSLAPGLVAGSYDLALSGPRRGLAMLDCPAPSPTWWFAGGGSTAGRNSTLFLVNPEATEAEVEVTIIGPDGEVDAPSLRGLVIPPFSRESVRLTRVAPRLPAAVWNVQVRTGRIVASLLDIDSEGFIQQGIDWVPPTADPATTVYIPGVLGTEGNRQLIIYPTSETDAEISVRFLAPDGAFRPTELENIQAPAGAVTSVNLAPALAGTSATVELTSDVPIVAGVRQQHPGIDANGPQTRIEVSYAAGALRLNSATAAAGLPAVRGTESTVWITAPRPAGTDDTFTTVAVSLTPFGADVQSPDPFTVDVPFDRAFPVTLGRPEGATWVTVQVTPSNHPIYVSQTSLRRGSRGSLISGYPLVPLRTTVSIPTAVQSVLLSLP